jgi:TPR repeat protein
MQTLGQAYLSGKGTNQNVSCGLSWLEKAAENGSISAMVRLGKYFLEGIFSELQPQLGVEWLEKAARASSSYAMISLGRYFIGGSTTKDISAGYYWLKKASALGSITAKWILGEYIVTGKIDELNATVGVEYLQEAAQFGSVPAMISLCTVFKKGIGVEPDDWQAYQWLDQAIRLGSQKDKRYRENWRLEARKNQDEIRFQAITQETLYFVQVRDHGSVEAMYKLGRQWIKQKEQRDEGLRLIKGQQMQAL